MIFTVVYSEPYQTFKMELRELFLRRASSYMFDRVLQTPLFWSVVSSETECIPWKTSAFGVFLVFIFPHSDWIRRDTKYLSIFSPNKGKHGPEKLWIWTLFTRWWFQKFMQIPEAYLEPCQISVVELHCR